MTSEPGSAPTGVRPPMLKSMDEPMRERMLDLLTNLMRRKAAADFNSRLDWEKHKLTQYPIIIKEPMDLGTVRQRLEADRDQPFNSKHYEYAEEFAHDVRLVCKNAFIFNQATTPVWKNAKSMGEIFEKQLAEAYHMQRSEMLGPPCPLKTRCQLLLSDIRRNPFSEFYRRDDWKEYGDSYVAALSSGQPMDLDQVQRRLTQNDYDVADESGTLVFQPEAFARDVNLVWANAMEFNKEHGKSFYQCAKFLKETFDIRLKMLLDAPVPCDRGKKREEREGWPSYQRKRDLGRKLSRLLPMDANDVLRVIRNSCAEAVSISTVHGEEQAVVELDKVDLATFEKAEGALRSLESAGLAADTAA